MKASSTCSSRSARRNRVQPYIDEQLAQKKKIMGIGHRVYKVLDPRAPHLREMAIRLSNELGDAKWIRMSEKIAALMKERKGLNANVDFYSATVYYSLGIPTDMFTPSSPSPAPPDGRATSSSSWRTIASTAPSASTPAPP